MLDLTTKALQGAFQVAYLRGQVIANNMANLDTPGFQRSFVPFQLTLDQLLGDVSAPLPSKPTTPRQIPLPNTGKDYAGLVQQVAGTGRVDGNNVSLDQEATVLAENTLTEETLGAQLQNRYAQFHLAINGGGNLG